MSLPDPVTAAESPQALAELNRWLAARSAEERVAWAVEHLAGHHALSSSFGAQAAVALHMTTRANPDIPTPATCSPKPIASSTNSPSVFR
jgi:phosphoadenosine phosphosulfate reductase